MSDEHPTLPYPRPSGEHPTLVIPDAAPAEAASRRRWPWVLAIVVLVLAALVVAAEFIARAVLPGIVRGIVIEQLDLPADQQLAVEADGILLPQLIGGRLDRLDLSTDAVSFGGITAAVDVTALGVPLRGGELMSADGTVRIDQGEFTTLLMAADLPIDELAFAAPDVTASGSLDMLGIPVPVSLTVTPGADAGELLLTPVELRIAGIVLNAEEISQRFGKLAAEITGTQRICIADQLPAGLKISQVEISGTEAVIGIDVDPALTSDVALQSNGVCP